MLHPKLFLREVTLQQTTWDRFVFVEVAL